MEALIAYYMAHQAAFTAAGPIVIAVLDYFIGKNPTSPASGILHWIEIQVQNILGKTPTPPAK